MASMLFGNPSEKDPRKEIVLRKISNINYTTFRYAGFSVLGLSVIVLITDSIPEHIWAKEYIKFYRAFYLFLFSASLIVIFILWYNKKLTKIIGHILENALKYVSKCPLEFGYIIEKENLKIYFNNAGLGMDPKNNKDLFNRFVIVTAKDSTIIDWFGLGLEESSEKPALINGKPNCQGKGFSILPYFAPEVCYLQLKMIC